MGYHPLHETLERRQAGVLQEAVQVLVEHHLLRGAARGVIVRDLLAVDHQPLRTTTAACQNADTVAVLTTDAALQPDLQSPLIFCTQGLCAQCEILATVQDCNVSRVSESFSLELKGSVKPFQIFK